MMCLVTNSPASVWVDSSEQFKQQCLQPQAFCQLHNQLYLGEFCCSGTLAAVHHWLTVILSREHFRGMKKQDKETSPNVNGEKKEKKKDRWNEIPDIYCEFLRCVTNRDRETSDLTLKHLP